MNPLNQLTHLTYRVHRRCIRHGSRTHAAGTPCKRTAEWTRNQSTDCWLSPTRRLTAPEWNQSTGADAGKAPCRV